jgi:hypothetical protein
VYPLIHNQLMHARVADSHRRAGQDRIARAAIQASRTRRKPGMNPVVGHPTGHRTRRVLTLLGTRSA